MFAHGMANAQSLSGRVLRRLFRWAYRRAKRVIALGPVMARRLLEKGVEPARIAVISNWATGREAIERGTDNSLRRKWDLEGKFVILYSGNLGIAHDVETPIVALRCLMPQAPHVRLVFIGKGSRLEDARRAAEREGVSHAVQFRPLVPSAMLPQSMGLAQIALVTLRKGFEGLVVPSKLLGYMARGVPTMYVGPYSDVEQTLYDSGGGACVRNGDAEGCARAIQSLIEDPGRLDALGRAASDFYEHRLSRASGLQEYSRVLRSAIEPSSR
ncbi:MAG: glycosyltransferase family 4 protein [Steroidobacteraceae bacterium]